MTTDRQPEFLILGRIVSVGCSVFAFGLAAGAASAESGSLLLWMAVSLPLAASMAILLRVCS